MSNGVKPRVFVSSVIEGYREMREAARRGILAADCEPVLGEDFPSLADSPRNACFDAVESCDAIVTVVGHRGGFRAPSGKLVVEEEYDHARSSGLQRFLFLQEMDRDPEAERLAARLSDYVTG